VVPIGLLDVPVAGREDVELLALTGPTGDELGAGDELDDIPPLLKGGEYGGYG